LRKPFRIAPSNNVFGDEVPTLLHSVRHSRYRQLRAGEPQKHQVHLVSVISDPSSQPWRKRTTGQCRLEPEARSLSREFIHPRQHHPTRCNRHGFGRERRKSNRDRVGIHVLPNSKRVAQ